MKDKQIAAVGDTMSGQPAAPINDGMPPTQAEGQDKPSFSLKALQNFLGIEDMSPSTDSVDSRPLDPKKVRDFIKGGDFNRTDTKK